MNSASKCRSGPSLISAMRRAAWLSLSIALATCFSDTSSDSGGLELVGVVALSFT